MRWSCWALCLAALCGCAFLQSASAAPSSLVETVAAYEDTFGPELDYRGDREKKEILSKKLIIGFGIQDFLLNFIFGKVNGVIDYKTALLKYFEKYNAYKNFAVGLGRPKNALPPGTGQEGSSLGFITSFLGTSVGGRRGGSRGPTISTTTEDIPDLSGDSVRLQVPDELFGSGFSILNRVTKIAGEVIMNTADRTERFVNSLKPFLGGVLKIETSNANRKG